MTKRLLPVILTGSAVQLWAPSLAGLQEGERELQSVRLLAPPLEQL